MAITSLSWKGFRGRDIHVLAGTSTRDLAMDDLRVTSDDGVSLSAAEHRANWSGSEVVFRPLFRAQTETATAVEGHGLKVFKDTGVVEVATGPVRKRNFIIEATARDAPGAKAFTERIRVQVHGSVQNAWLTPDELTVRPTKHPLTAREQAPQWFTVRARFDDGVIGDLTEEAGIGWSAPVAGHNVDGDGRLWIETGDKPGDKVTITATLPVWMGADTAQGTMRIETPWSQLPRPVEIAAGSTWPFTIAVEKVPNVLFVGDGFAAGDATAFNGLVDTFTADLRKATLTRPFDVLAGSMNYWKTFHAAAPRGISVRGEVYLLPGAKEARPLPSAKPPPAPGTPWNLEHLVYAVGLPVPADAAAYEDAAQDAVVNAAIRKEWKDLVDPDPNPRVPDALLARWKALARRTFVAEMDTFPGLGYGMPPAASQRAAVALALHPGRGGVLELRRFCTDLFSPRGITVPGGHPVGRLWGLLPDDGETDEEETDDGVEDPDAIRFENRDLVVILSSFPGGRARNANGYMTLSPQDGAQNVGIPVTVPSPGGEARLNAPAVPARMPGPAMRTGAHELAHSFGLGDEYEEVEGTYAKAESSLNKYGNLQTVADASVDDPANPGKKRLEAAEIKWNWHRVRKAAVLTAKPTAGSAAGTFLIPVRLGDGVQFSADDPVLLRERTWGGVLGKKPKVLQKELRVVGKPTEDKVVVKAAPGVSVALPELLDFGAGSLLFLPVPAKAGSGYARMISPPIAALLAKGPLFPPKDGCAPNFDDSVVPGLPGVSLPFCFTERPRVVGAYPGGDKYPCGILHPAGTCMMRSSGTAMQFCAVCRYVMVDLVDPSKHWEMDLDYDKVYLA